MKIILDKVLGTTLLESIGGYSECVKWYLQSKKEVEWNVFEMQGTMSQCEEVKLTKRCEEKNKIYCVHLMLQRIFHFRSVFS